MKRKILGAGILAVLMLLTAMLPVCASVTTGSLGEPKLNTVYVAGNSNFYPVEYYDFDQKRFDGVLPEVLPALCFFVPQAEPASAPHRFLKTGYIHIPLFWNIQTSFF